MPRSLPLCVAMVLTAAGSAAIAAAPPYPSKPIRMVITYPPGGNTDLFGRAVAQKMAENMGHQVVVDNRGGAGGIIGTMITAQAAADGYTIMLGTSAGMILNPLLSKKLPYDPFKDFVPVSLVVVLPQLMVTNPAMPMRTVKDLISLAKAKPGFLNAGSSGVGTPNHLGVELLKSLAGLDIVHVPYKGGGQAITDLIAGQVQLAFSSVPSVLPHVKAGRLHGMAIGSAKRSPALPQVPTIAETVPGYEYTTWYGIFAPAATPKPILARLNSEIVKILAAPEMSQRFSAWGGDPASSTPEALTRYMREEMARWAKTIQTAGIRID